ncbi:MAG: S1/P1 nuclease [Candidatus Sumerlaeia bacterium]|nr:S1/P1 nuclease [Candidatus Sumerlaeia bacterium]
MSRLVLLLIVCLLALAPVPSWAWGRDGHRIVAAMAESRLTPTALERVRAILGEDTSLASVSTWADEVRPRRRESAPWHYVNIPIEGVGVFEPELCPNDDCVTMIIGRMAATLADAQMYDPLEVEEALKFIVHFLGDQAQPLHNANEADDRGGNAKRLVFFDRETNLHSLWDTGLIRRELESRGIDAAAFGNELNEEIRPESLRRWVAGTPIDWSNEAHAVAQDFVYPGWAPELGEDYFRKSIGPVRVQLQRGGVRTAHLLNSIFDTQYDGLPTIRRPFVLEDRPDEGVRPQLAPVFEQAPEAEMPVAP